MNATKIPEPDKLERIAKVLARAGIASRREVERLIEAGRIAIDGVKVSDPATKIAGSEGVTLDGEPVKSAEPVQLWRYYKPSGLVTTHHDPQGRKTVFEMLPAGLPRVISVGRLDLNSEGLLLLTNDGALARHFEHPKTGLQRRYRVRVHGKPDPQTLAALKDGVTIDGITYGPVEAAIERVQGSNAWLEVTLTEGKNREIRKLMAHLDLDVTRLIRIAYGPYLLGRLTKGEVKPVPRSEWIDLAIPVLDEMTQVAKAGKPARPKGWAKAKPRPKKPPRGRKKPDPDRTQPRAAKPRKPG